MAILAGAVPFLMLQSLVPVLKDGLHVWLASLLPVTGITAVVGTLVVVSVMRPRSWLGGLVRALGWLVVAVYAVGVVLGLAVLLRAVLEASSDLSFMSAVNIVGWVLVSPLAWLALGVLRSQTPAT